MSMNEHCVFCGDRIADDVRALYDSDTEIICVRCAAIHRPEQPALPVECPQIGEGGKG